LNAQPRYTHAERETKRDEDAWIRKECEMNENMDCLPSAIPYRLRAGMPCTSTPFPLEEAQDLLSASSIKLNPEKKLFLICAVGPAMTI
jgi:hypothetical protein